MPADLWAVGYWYRGLQPDLGRGGQWRCSPSAAHHDDDFVDAAGVAREAQVSAAASGRIRRRSEVAIALAGACRSRASSPCPRLRAAWSCSRTAADRAASARATAPSPGRSATPGFATLLFDLLTPTRSGDRANVFDIPLLAERLVAATRVAGG